MTDAEFASLLSKHKRATVGLCRFTWKEGTGNIVECDTLQTCDRCGWNPEVAKKRADKVREALKSE